MNRFSSVLLGSVLVASAATLACSSGDDGGRRPQTLNGSGGGSNGGTGNGGTGSGSGTGNGGLNIGTGAGPMMGAAGASMEDCDSTLELIIRDFNSDHPDMERDFAGETEMACGYVKPNLFIGGDGTRTPLFHSSEGTGKRFISDGVITCDPWNLVNNMNVPPAPSKYEIEGADSFNQWYTNVDTINSAFEYTLNLKPTPDNPDLLYFDSAEIGGFFPADGQGFNEQTNGHNFHFTTEAHVRFVYKGGERFTFSGDDDMWIFVNGKLALDLGGLHGPVTATIDFDAQAAELGITARKTYNMDIFHAERHTSDSNYRVETTLGCFETVDVPLVVVR